MHVPANIGPHRGLEATLRIRKTGPVAGWYMVDWQQVVKMV